MEVRELITLNDVRAAKPAKIYYAARTCWWTHDPRHLSVTQSSEAAITLTAENYLLNALSPNSKRTISECYERARKVHAPGLPCDPRGSVLFETDNIEAFLTAAEENPARYGKHGLRAFVAAHHQNCFAALFYEKHWSETTWQHYNDALDRLDERMSQAQ